MLKALAIRLLPPSLVKFIHYRRVVGKVVRTMRRSARREAMGQPHQLAAPLFVTLTSFPPRFDTLHLTLKSLLLQSVRPDGILLWIAHDDLHLLPETVRDMMREGVRIMECDDLRSFKKLVPALETHADAYLVTADDDVYYPSDWLATLLDEVRPDATEILCCRAHRLTRRESILAPYSDWQEDVQDEAAHRPSTDLVPVGVGGVLYPPRSLSREVGDRSLFQRLCRDTDDLWFFWMARRAGTPHRKVGGRFRQIHWPKSQQGRLFEQNEDGGNDDTIRRLEAHFGPLPRDSTRVHN